MPIRTDWGDLRESAIELRAQKQGPLIGTSVQQDLLQIASAGYVLVPPPIDGNLYGVTNAAWVSGGQMINPLTIAPQISGHNATITLNKPLPAGTAADQIIGQSGGSNRWALLLGDTAAETGSNAGSNLQLIAFNDAGSQISNPLEIIRATGQTIVNGNLNIVGTSNGFEIIPSAYDAFINLQKPAAGYADIIYAYTGANLRWTLQLGDRSNETGSDTGSNFLIQNYHDNGTLIDTPLTIIRATGGATFSSTLNVTGATTLSSTLSVTGASTFNGTVTFNSGVNFDGSPVTISPASGNSALVLNKPASGQADQVIGQTAGLNRWAVVAGDSSAESTGNAGSNFVINNYTDAGALIDTPFQINRATQAATFKGPSVTINALAAASASIYLNKAVSGQINRIMGETNGLFRWEIQPGNGAPESTGNAGSDFGIYRYNDAGSLIDGPLVITRSTANVVLSNNLQVGSTALGAGTSGYVFSTAITIAPGSGGFQFNSYSNTYWQNGFAATTYLDNASGAWSLVLAASGTAGTTPVYNQGSISLAQGGAFSTSGSATIAGILRDTGSRIISQGVANNPSIGSLDTNAGGYAAGFFASQSTTRMYFANLDGSGNYVSTLGFFSSGGALYTQALIQSGTAGGGGGFYANGNFPSGGNTYTTWFGDTGNTAGIGGIYNQPYNVPGTVYAIRWVINGQAYDFRHDGNAAKPGGGAWIAVSDERIKTVTGDYTAGLAEIEQLNPVRYTYLGNDTSVPPSNSAAMPSPDPPEPIPAPADEPPLVPPYPNSPHYTMATTGKSFVGLVAQAVEGVMPELIAAKHAGYINGVKVDDLLHLDPGPLTFALINAVKELSKRVKALELGQGGGPQTAP